MKTNEKVTKKEKEMITNIIDKEFNGMNNQTITMEQMNNHLENIVDSIIKQSFEREPKQLPSMKQSEMDMNELMVFLELKIFSKDNFNFFTDYESDVKKMVKKAYTKAAKNRGISFVIYKKKETGLIFFDMLWYETSSVDIDEYTFNEENEYVTWVKNYDRKEGGMGVALYKFNLITDETYYDFYHVNNDGTLKLIKENDK